MRVKLVRFGAEEVKANLDPDKLSDLEKCSIAYKGSLVNARNWAQATGLKFKPSGVLFGGYYVDANGIAFIPLAL